MRIKKKILDFMSKFPIRRLFIFLSIMEKTYSSRPYRIFLNLVYGIFAAGVVGILVGYISDKVSYATVAAILAFLAYLWLVIIQNLITITVSKTHLTVKKGSKESFFDLNQCNFRAKTVTRS